MTVIDVNTGKNTDKKTVSETYLKTNLEAAEEIAVQLRLRNLSGIIMVDFIDMKEKAQNEELMKRLRQCLAGGSCQNGPGGHDAPGTGGDHKKEDAPSAPGAVFPQ